MRQEGYQPFTNPAGHWIDGLEEGFVAQRVYGPRGNPDQAVSQTADDSFHPEWHVRPDDVPTVSTGYDQATVFGTDSLGIVLVSNRAPLGDGWLCTITFHRAFLHAPIPVLTHNSQDDYHLAVLVPSLQEIVVYVKGMASAVASTSFFYHVFANPTGVNVTVSPGPTPSGTGGGQVVTHNV